jgi:hypothetical protein
MSAFLSSWLRGCETRCHASELRLPDSVAHPEPTAFMHGLTAVLLQPASALRGRGLEVGGPFAFVAAYFPRCRLVLPERILFGPGRRLPRSLLVGAAARRQVDVPIGRAVYERRSC